MRGPRCRACGAIGSVEVDHIKPRGQGGQSDVENGLVLCGPFGCGAHDRKTASLIKIEFEWLDPDQVEYLEAQGWVTFDAVTGEPSGLGWKHFNARRTP